MGPEGPYLVTMLKTIAASIVGSRLDYCNSVLYGESHANTDRLQHVQNVLARVVAQAPQTISSVHIRRDLHWLPVNPSVTSTSTSTLSPDMGPEAWAQRAHV